VSVARAKSGHSTLHLAFRRRMLRPIKVVPFIASRKARSNTSSTPTPVIALTSAYFAPIRRAAAAPSSWVTGWRP
jgi:hypothetical protein